MDLSLPDRTGIELMSELRQLRPKLTIVVATAYAGMARADLRDNPAPQLVLAKPYDETAIADVLARLNIPINQS